MDASPYRPRIEREFGVPIPGEILEPTRWARTALKTLPAEGRLDWATLFGRRAPIVLDVGCGNGRFTLHSAVARPDHDHLGVDPLPLVLRYATRRANQRGLANVRFAACDGLRLVERFVEPGSVREVHCYHPQPYYDPSQIHRRLIEPRFLSLVHAALEPDGLVVVQTDNPGYWLYMRAVLPVFFDFEELAGRWPDAPRGRTRREILARRRGLPVFRGQGRPKKGLSVAEAQQLAEALPPPTFDADRRLRALDAEEQRGGR